MINLTQKDKNILLNKRNLRAIFEAGKAAFDEKNKSK
jgi:hypothetical protein